eukprot:918217-Prorocentrum_minimum.AAC.1
MGGLERFRASRDDQPGDGKVEHPGAHAGRLPGPHPPPPPHLPRPGHPRHPRTALACVVQSVYPTGF